AGATNVSAQDGNDTVNVGSQAGLWETAPGLFQFIDVKGTVNGIGGLLTVDGGAQAALDQLNVDDTGDPADNIGWLTSSQITGLGMTGGGIVYGAFEDLNINLGTGNDTFTIRSTHAGAARTTKVEGRGGNDTLNVNTIDGPTTVAGDGLAQTLTFGINSVDTGSGDDLINVGSRVSESTPNFEGVLSGIRAPLVVEGLGQQDVDRLVTDDSGDLVGRTGLLTVTTLTGLGMAPAGITYTGIESLHVMLGRGDDHFHIASTIPGTTRLSGGPGADQITVQQVNGGTQIEGDDPVIPAMES